MKTEDPDARTGDTDAQTNAAPETPNPARARASAVPEGMRRVRLTRSIIMNGQHAEVGEVHDVARALAHRLIGEGSAEPQLAPGEKGEPAPTSVNRMESPTSRDPQSRRIASAPPKVKK